MGIASPIAAPGNGINGSFDPIAAPCALPIDSPGRPYRVPEFASYQVTLVVTCVPQQCRRRGVGVTVAVTCTVGHCTTHCSTRGKAPRIKGPRNGLRKETLRSPLRLQWAVHGAPHRVAHRALQWATRNGHAVHEGASGMPPLRNRLRTPLRTGLRTGMCTGQCNTLCVRAEPIHAPGEWNQWIL